MNRSLKIKIFIGIIIGLIWATILVLKFLFDWSVFVVLWTTVLILIVCIVYFIAIRVSKSQPQKEQIEDLKAMSRDEVSEAAVKWMKQNDYLADNCKMINVNLIVPQQEGDNKISYWKVKIERYWYDDILFMATKTDKIDFELTETYDKTDKKAEDNFDERLNKAVFSPEQIATVRSIIEDPMTGEKRIIEKQSPSWYLKQAEEKKIERKTEKEEGVEE